MQRKTGVYAAKQAFVRWRRPDSPRAYIRMANSLSLHDTKSQVSSKLEIYTIRDQLLSNLRARWNAEDFLMLRKDNLPELTTAISSQQLPKTFVDAIEITRSLEVDYIWIDSLCIMQDDEDDWRRETALMENIYGGSYLNIAASSATSVHGGCWVATNGAQSGFRTKVSVGDGELVREFRDDQCYDDAVWESHLATRAWALPEKLLPSRTLHLGDRGAFWECKLKIASEYLPDGFTQRPVSYTHLTLPTKRIV